MISALLLTLLGTDSPQTGQAMELARVYTECLGINSAARPLERHVAEKRIRVARRRCGAARKSVARSLSWFVPGMLETPEGRQETERRLVEFESGLVEWLILEPSPPSSSQPK